MSKAETHELRLERAEDKDAEALFRGTVSRITFHNKESGFGVLKAEQENLTEGSPQGHSISTVVGVFQESLSEGASIVARGSWHTHPKFGKQFKARAITETAPTTEDAIERYLGSAVKGLGPVLARRIIDTFGPDSLSILDTEPSRLREVPGIGEKKLQDIVEGWKSNQALKEVFLFFQNHNLSQSLAQRIFNVFGARTVEIVKENPYLLARNVWGIGFQTADRIAQSIGIEPYAIERLIAGLIFTLKRSADDGHCFLSREELLRRASVLLNIDDFDSLERAIDRAMLEVSVIVEVSKVYLPELYDAERVLGYEVAKRARIESTPRIAIDETIIQSYSEKPVVTAQTQVTYLSKEQQHAIELVGKRSLLVITGGPGCGKTTVVQTIAKMLRYAGLRVKLAAPTGRAAQRMSEVCDMEASTIHRLLKYDPIERGFRHNKHEPLELDALIVDEASMIDVPLGASLFSALPDGVRVIIVGDADQLPSVGPGRILGDLLHVEQIPRVKLTTLFRRDSDSSITHVAHKINEGTFPSIPSYTRETKSDSYFISAENQHSAAEKIERLVCDEIPKQFGLSGANITVLSPMNQGELGVIALNQRLQARLVPEVPGTPKLIVGNLELRLGDRVCQRVNNYNLSTNGVFNGDQGEIIGIDAVQQSVHVRLWDKREVEYPKEYLSQLDLAYALTVHRSQGSEVPAVVLALHPSHTVLLERQLVYTAVTRAKKLLFIVGAKKALQFAIQRSRSTNRFTFLQERIVNNLHS